MVGILVSFWDGLFSGAMLVSGRVTLFFLRGTNLSLTITTWPRVLADFNFDCVIGPSRVPAKLMQAGIRSVRRFRKFYLRHPD